MTNVLKTITQRRRQIWRRQEDGGRDQSDVAINQGMTATRNQKRHGILLWVDVCVPTQFTC